ncbi:Uncharacterized protein APZ42_032444 [Daphnia magna]|uniref:Uncharacterized protein n=1 Tax=Daphnia magna TaxID=35525 RepID=A0A164LZT5_9CRUS|nr:Uncharacterized protein APZ42_032444 [Daphnia magna]
MADQNSNSSNKQDFVLHILVTFTDGTFGILTGKSFFKTKFPQKSDIEDWVVLLKSWWPAGVDVSTSWNLLDYEGPADCNKSKQSLHNGSILKSGTIMFYSESIDEIRKERDKLILQGNESKYLKTTDGKQKFEYPTKYPPNYVTPEKKENQSQKLKITINEMDLEIYYNQLASKELQILELNEKIAELENEQAMVLIKEIKDVLAEMNTLVHNIRAHPIQGQHLRLQDSSASAGNNALTSAKSNTACLHTGTRMKKLWGDVMVSESCIRKIAIALKTDQKTDTCRNRIAALILDDLYTIEELANMSLSGRKCPGQDRVAKPKLPPEIISAIHSRP